MAKARTRLGKLLPLLLVLIAPANTASGEIVLSPDHSWGIETPVPDDMLVEYLLCDDDACHVWDTGDPSRAGAPIRMKTAPPGLQTLRARLCHATPAGTSSGSCGPESEPSHPFRFDSSLSPTQFVLTHTSRNGSSLFLSQGQEHTVRLPLGIAPPIVESVLRFGLNVSSETALVHVEVRGHDDPTRIYLDQSISYPRGKTDAEYEFSALEDAFLEGEKALEVTVANLRGQVAVGLGDPLSARGLRAVHVAVGILSRAAMTLLDADHDGVLRLPWVDFGFCGSQQWLGCSDNCPSTYNPDQADRDQDAVGDVCLPEPGEDPETIPGLVALYLFDEGEGDTVHDLSGVYPPVDLRIVDPEVVSWVWGGGLSLDAATQVESKGLVRKISDAIATTGELTLEAWITPSNTTQTGPARIFTISEGLSSRNLTLGQSSQGFGSHYIALLRSSETTPNGTPALGTDPGTLTTDLTHVVFTRDSNGETRIYLDGVEVAGGSTDGDLTGWDSGFRMALGGEFDSRAGSWTGTYRRVAVYSRALAQWEVAARFEGPVDEGRVSGNLLPIVRFSTDPSVGAAPLTVTLDASDSFDPDGEVAAYHWQFGDGTRLTVDEPTVAHRYNSSGTYRVTLMVIDREMAVSSMTRILRFTSPEEPPPHVPTGSYESGACLQHWWRPGHDPSDIGRDYGVSAHPIDVYADAPSYRVNSKDIRGDPDGPYLDLSGWFDYLANKTPHALDIANAWTVAVWFRPDDLAPSWLRPEQNLVAAVPQDGHANQWEISFVTSLPGNPVQVLVYDASGRVGKNYHYEDLLVEGVWTHLAVSWDGNELRLWLNGVPQPATVKRTDHQDVTLDGGSRVQTYIGRNPGGGHFRGGLHSVAIWKKPLDSGQVAEISNAGTREFDLRRGDEASCR